MVAEQLLLQSADLTMFLWLVPLIIWEIIWKGIALWKSGRNNQLVWFIFILIVNSLGILPIVYIAFFQKKNSSRKTQQKNKKTKPRKRR